MSSRKVILAFESSCDETAVALLQDNGHILFEKIYSQIETHKKYGGVVPEVASRSHFDKIDEISQLALGYLREQKLELVAVAATQGPGLIGALLVGSSYAQGLASGFKVPFIGVHHLRGHIASSLLGANLDSPLLSTRAQEIFPALVLLVSGGHTQILFTESNLNAQPLIESVDDAAGECFDKCAKLMGLPYPGGPEIEKRARLSTLTTNEIRQSYLKALPRPKTQEGDFSFSGLKTSIRTQLEKNPALSKNPDFCWAIQEVIGEILVRGLDRSLKKITNHALPKNLIFCGGVSANERIRARVFEWAAQNNLTLRLAPIKYCTDNAAMIAAASWIQDKAFHMSSPVARLALGNQRG